jgi:hypothetical protein
LDVDADLRQFIFEKRGEDKKDALEGVVEAAIAYQAEGQREDRAHRGRLSQRERDLVQAIDFAHALFRPGPLSEERLAHYRRVFEARRQRQASE